MENKDVQFYESLLSKIENEDNVKVVKTKVCEACEKGENFVTNVQRVFIEGSKKSGPYSITLVAKNRSQTTLAQKYNFDEVFRNEVDAFKHILPALKKHSKSKLLIPECFYLSDDLIIIEDLASSGYKCLPSGHRFDVKESLIVLKELAKLHAASLALQEREPAAVDELKKMLTDIYQNDKHNVFEDSLRVQIKNAALVIQGAAGEKQSNQEIVARLKEIEKNGYKQICDLFQGGRKLSVFNHGDPWGNNILFKEDTARLVDFQMMRFTSVAADLCCFLSINLHPSDRRANLEELLSGYLEELRKYSRENGVAEETVAEMTMVWLKSELEDFKLFGFLSTIFILPVFYFQINQETIEKVDCEDFNLMTEEHKSAIREYVLDFFSDLE